MEGLHGNCLPQDDTQVLSIDIVSNLGIKEKRDEINQVRSAHDLIDTEWDHDYVTSLTKINQLSGFQESVTEYIAGFVVRQVIKSLECDVCCQEVSKQNSSSVYKLVNLKDKGGLVRASEDVLRVCQTAEICLQRIIKTCHGVAPFSAHLLTALTMSVLEIVSERYP